MIAAFTGEHGGFILGSYAAAGLIVGGLIAWVLVDGRQQRMRLAALESAGLRRAGTADRGHAGASTLETGAGDER